MEALFEPTSRLRDLTDRNQSTCFPDDLKEIELKAKGHSSVEEILRSGRTSVGWKDFLSVARNRLVWLDPHVFITADGEIDDCMYSEVFEDLRYEQVILVMVGSYSYYSYSESDIDDVNADDDRETFTLWSPSATQATIVCQLLLRLLTNIDNDSSQVHVHVECHSAPSSLALSTLLNNFPCIQSLRLSSSFVLTKGYIRVLTAAIRPHHEILLSVCSLSRIEPMPILAFFRTCRGAIILQHCQQRSIPLISNILRGSSSLVNLSLWDYGYGYVDVPPLNSLFEAIATNTSLKVLSLRHKIIIDESWLILCHSITRHSTLETVDVRRTGHHWPETGTPSDARKTLRTEAVLNVLQANTVLQDLYLTDDEFDERVMSGVIRPYLRYLPRIRAFVGKYSNDPGHAKVLGRALHKVNTNPALIFLLLSTNVVELGRGRGSLK